jgi:hypothetical protein
MVNAGKQASQTYLDVHGAIICVRQQHRTDSLAVPLHPECHSRMHDKYWLMPQPGTVTYLYYYMAER